MKQTILLLIILFICSCTLFKKTTKATDIATQSSSNQMESSQLFLKAYGKETQIFTYWNDSGFYQYQHIKEQVDQARAAKVTIEEKQDAKQSNTLKKAEPVNTWIYILVLIGGLGCYLIYRSKIF